MKQRTKKLIKKISSVFLKPFFDEYLMTLSHQDQILLSLKYKESTQCLDFDQVGFNVYSSTYEDGILLYIFSLVGMTNRRCVDIGAGPISGSNVANLIVNHGFTGLLMDGNPESMEVAKQYYLDHPETRLFPPKTVTTIITAENVNTVLRENGLTGEIDLLCLDIDGVDYWVWKSIDVVHPRIVLVEYQDILGPDRSWTVPYRPDFNLHDYPVNKQANNYCGASLRAFVGLAKCKGYRLVGSSRCGWNAFFVRNGIDNMYLPEVSVESCFKHEWNIYGMEKRFPLVKDMEWQEV